MSGESSSSNQSDDNNTGSPKLKKARFIWEVKGNYHLKNTSESSEYAMTNKREQIDANDQKNASQVSPNTSCCLRAFVEKSEEILDDLNDADSVIDDDLPFDQRQEHNCIAQERVFSLRYLQWHTRRKVRYDMENRINLMIEEIFGNDPESHKAINISDIVEDAETDLDLKDESILMAIESHGLRANDNHEVLYSEKEHEFIQNTENSPDDDILLKKCYGKTDSIINEESTSSDISETQDDFLVNAVSAAIIQKGLYHSSPSLLGFKS